MSQTKRITELEDTLQTLRVELEQLRSAPAGIQSKLLHDLNGSLAVAQGQAHMALLELSANAKARHSVEEVCKALKSALGLVGDIHANSQKIKKSQNKTAATVDESKLHGSGTVLVVDDEESMRDMVKRVLSHYGYTVVLAGNGEEALRLFKKDHKAIQLVLMDMTMPKVNGLEAFKKMQEVDADVPVVMTSGYSEINLAQKYPELGIRDFLRKPCALPLLLQTVSQNVRKAA